MPDPAGRARRRFASQPHLFRRQRNRILGAARTALCVFNRLSHRHGFYFEIIKHVSASRHERRENAACWPDAMWGSIRPWAGPSGRTATWILRGKDFRTTRISIVLSLGQVEQFVYALVQVWSTWFGLKFDVSVFGPMAFLQRAGRSSSNSFSERLQRRPAPVRDQVGVWLEPLVIRFKRRAPDWRKFGTWLVPKPPLPQRRPSAKDRKLDSSPLRCSAELAALPGPGMAESDIGIKWYPETGWDKAG